jgi:hypothetical protein
LALLESLNVRHIVVTFPVESLGRREKGMAQNYTDSFVKMLTGEPWTVARLEYSSELVFVVDKR